MFVKRIVDMDFAVIAMGLVCAAMLAGCGGFTEDTNTANRESAGNGELGALVAKKYAEARTTQTGFVAVDEKSDSLTLVLETFGGCLKQDGHYVWNPDYYHADSIAFGYRFSGDSLYLSQLYESGTTREYDTFIYYGGENGKLDGVWQLFLCLYVDDQYGCVNDGYEKFMKIDGDKVEFRAGDLPGFNYMESVFINDLFDYLEYQLSIMITGIFYNANLDKEKEEYGITVTSQTDSAMTFTYDNHTFEVELKHVSYHDSVSVVVTSGSIQCIASYREFNDMTPELCNDGNSKYMRGDDEGALRVERDNEIEFETCIDSILGREHRL